MMISDPPLIFDFQKIGQKVSFNQYKQECLDGFINAGEDSGPIIFQCGFEIPRGSQISDFEPKVALKYGFPLIKEAYFELVHNKYLVSNPQPFKEKTFRARRLTTFELYNEIDVS